MTKILNKIDRQSLEHYGKTLKYSLYVITHPLDGFWDLKHEKRGSLAASITIIMLVLLTRILNVQFTSFLFNKVKWDEVNVFMICLQILVPLVVFGIANWGLTTLFDGKGTLKEVFTAVGYALTPYVLIQLPMTFISNLFIDTEGAFYYYSGTFAIIWCAFLLISGMMMTHEYSLGKTMFALFATIVGMMVIFFVAILFFSLTSDAVDYFISLYKEIVFRFY